MPIWLGDPMVSRCMHFQLRNDSSRHLSFLTRKFSSVKKKPIIHRLLWLRSGDALVVLTVV